MEIFVQIFLPFSIIFLFAFVSVQGVFIKNKKTSNDLNIKDNSRLNMFYKISNYVVIAIEIFNIYWSIFFIPYYGFGIITGIPSVIFFILSIKRLKYLELFSSPTTK